MTSITNDQNIQAWTSIPDERIEKFGDYGDFSRQHILNPALFSLLGEVKSRHLLDAGSGTGYLSRLLAKQGAHVTGIEPAEKLYTYAVAREQKEQLGITYIKQDLSIWKPRPNTFDIVVSNMVFMDILDYKPAIKNCITSLKHNGALIFSISHPCFEEGGDRDEYFEEYAVEQFTGHFFHRTLSSYIDFLIENGCAIEKFLEPQLSEKIAKDNPFHERGAHVPFFLVIKARFL